VPGNGALAGLAFGSMSRLGSARAGFVSVSPERPLVGCSSLLAEGEKGPTGEPPFAGGRHRGMRFVSSQPGGCTGCPGATRAAPP
jgi:hypothetical protein